MWCFIRRGTEGILKEEGAHCLVLCAVYYCFYWCCFYSVWICVTHLVLFCLRAHSPSVTSQPCPGSSGHLPPVVPMQTPHTLGRCPKQHSDPLCIPTTNRGSLTSQSHRALEWPIPLWGCFLISPTRSETQPGVGDTLFQVCPVLGILLLSVPGYFFFILFTPL